MHHITYSTVLSPQNATETDSVRNWFYHPYILYNNATLAYKTGYLRSVTRQW